MPLSTDTDIVGLGKGTLVDSQAHSIEGIDVQNRLTDADIRKGLAIGHLVLIDQHIIVVDSDFKTVAKVGL